MGCARKNKQILLAAGIILYVLLLVLLKDIRPWSPRVIDYSMADPQRGMILSFCNFNPLVDWDTIQFHWHFYLANVVLLLPFGFLMGYLAKNRVRLWTAGVVGCILLETLQLITRSGVFDIVTVILGIIGYAIGYGIFRIVKKVIA